MDTEPKSFFRGKDLVLFIPLTLALSHPGEGTASVTTGFFGGMTGKHKRVFRRRPHSMNNSVLPYAVEMLYASVG